MREVIEAYTTEIIKRGILEIKINNIDKLSEEEYAMVRKESFGGSDSSILCGVNLYKIRCLRLIFSSIFLLLV